MQQFRSKWWKILAAVIAVSLGLYGMDRLGFATLEALSGKTSSTRSGPASPSLREISLSPDGSRVLFQYCATACRTGIYDVSKDTYSYLNAPTNKQFLSPRYSPDGAAVVATIACSTNCVGDDAYRSEVVLINPTTAEYRQVSNSRRYKTKPVLERSGKNLTLVVRDFILDPKTGKPVGLHKYGIALLNINTGNETDILSSEEGFSFIGSFSQTNARESLFTARDSARQKERIEALVQIGRQDADVTNALYSLTADGLPKLHTLNKGKKEISNVSASQDGKQLVYFQESSIERLNSSRQFNYELFLYEDGKETQITDLKAFIEDATISGDGKVSAILADTRGRDFDLYIVNLHSRDVRKTNLLTRLQTSTDKSF